MSCESARTSTMPLNSSQIFPRPLIHLSMAVSEVDRYGHSR